jgi:tryptophan-rich sensory protein
MSKKYGRIILSAILCVVLGSVGGLFTASEITGWYQSLNKPAWNPPNWLFGPVWTLLYLMMGIAAAQVWNQQSIYKTRALQLFGLQFCLNLLWSFLFFNRHWIGVALVEIILLWVLIVLTIRSFYKVRPSAALLLLPYVLWVTFAAFLNGAFFILNR